MVFKKRIFACAARWGPWNNEVSLKLLATIYSENMNTATGKQLPDSCRAKPLLLFKYCNEKKAYGNHFIPNQYIESGWHHCKARIDDMTATNWEISCFPVKMVLALHY